MHGGGQGVDSPVQLLLLQLCPLTATVLCLTGT